MNEIRQKYVKKSNELETVLAAIGLFAAPSVLTFTVQPKFQQKSSKFIDHCVYLSLQKCYTQHYTAAWF